MGNVGKAIIPMVRVRYICFYRMFLYSLAVFISLPKCGPEKEQKLMRLMLGAGALGRPRGMVWGGRREESTGWGTRVYLWRIHVDI